MEHLETKETTGDAAQVEVGEEVRASVKETQRAGEAGAGGQARAGREGGRGGERGREGG